MRQLPFNSFSGDISSVLNPPSRDSMVDSCAENISNNPEPGLVSPVVNSNTTLSAPVAITTSKSSNHTYINESNSPQFLI